VRLRVGSIDLDRLVICPVSRKAVHHPSENTHDAPTLPPIVERLVRAILLWSIPPAQAVTVDENNPAQHTTVINTRPAVAFRENSARRLIYSTVS